MTQLQAASKQASPTTPGKTDQTANTISRVFAAIPDRALSALLAGSLLVFAEMSATNEWITTLIIPAPTSVWSSLIDGFASGLYWPHMWSTLAAMLAGFLAATVSAIMLAGLVISVARLERILLPLIIAFQTLPKIAIAPVIILWLGFDLEAKTVVVLIVAFFPIFMNTLHGLRIRDRQQLELIQSLGGTRWQLFRYLRAPGAIPFIFAGLHIGIIFAVIGAVVAEFVGTREGLGFILLQQKAQFNVPGVFAILVILMVIGLLLHGIMLILERKIAFWATDVSTVSL